MSSNPQPRFSDGSDTTDLETSLAPLLTTNGGRWTLTADGEGLEREFKFKTFAKTWVSNKTTPLSTTMNHRPFNHPTPQEKRKLTTIRRTS